MPKQVDHAQYRRELLQKSFEAFAEHGYSALSMRELANKLHVSTGTLYHYFPNKQALFDQLVEFLADTDFGLASRLPAPSASLREKVIALFDCLEENEIYFLKQTAVWMDFYRQQAVHTKSVAHSKTAAQAKAAAHSKGKVHTDTSARTESEQLIQLTSARYREWFTTYFAIKDQSIVTFIICVLSGITLERTYERNLVSYREQALILADMLETHQSRGGPK